MIVPNLSTYSYADIGGSLWGTAVFALVLMCPGYVVGWAVDLFGFRSKSLAERLAWGVVLSFCVTTITAVLLTKWLSLLAACCIAGVMGVLALGLTARDSMRKRLQLGLGRFGWMICGVLLLWTLMAVVELVDIGLGSKLYASVTLYDHAIRTAIVDAVVRTGVPPINPLYWPGHGAPMRYYYFWYVLCAMVVKMGHVSARQSMIASCVWGGFGLASILALYERYFVAPKEAVRKRVLVALGLLTVTGLDLIPVFLGRLGGIALPGDMEWWATDQVTSWADSLFWVPHHIAGLVCCLTGFLLIWRSKTEGRWWICVAIAGAAFASAFGLTVWVALGFAMVLGTWLPWALLRQGDSRRVTSLIAAGVIAVVLLAPYLRELRSGTSRSAESQAAPRTRLLALEARRIIDPDVLMGFPGFKQLRARNPHWEDRIAALTLMLPGYGLELGFYALVLGIAISRWRSLDEAGKTAVYLSLSCLIITSVVRSDVIHNNDFAVRVSLIAQFFLVLLAVEVMNSWNGLTRKVGLSLIVVGVAGSVYQTVMLRIALPHQEHVGRIEVARLSETNMALRVVFDAMEARVPTNAVIAYEPSASDFYDFVYTANLDRQAVNATPDCNSAFGGERGPCPGIKDALARIYGGGTDKDARKACKFLGAEYLVATKWDLVWQRNGSWVWTLPVVAETPAARVLACAGSREPQTAQ